MARLVRVHRLRRVERVRLDQHVITRYVPHEVRRGSRTFFRDSAVLGVVRHCNPAAIGFLIHGRLVLVVPRRGGQCVRRVFHDFLIWCLDPVTTLNNARLIVREGFQSWGESSIDE